MTIYQRVQNEGVVTDMAVPKEFAALLVKILENAPVRYASGIAEASYEQLFGHALDPLLLKFREPESLESMFIEANAPPKAGWRSFGCIAVVSPPPIGLGPVATFRRVDFYSVFPRDPEGPIYVGDFYLRINIDRHGRVLDAVQGTVASTAAAGAKVQGPYGTMMYFAALVTSGIVSQA